MKLNTIISLIIFSIISSNSFGQLAGSDYNGKDLEQFKASKTYYVQTGSAEFDSAVASGLKEYWKITPYEIINGEDFNKRITDNTCSFLVSISFVPEEGFGSCSYLAVFNGGKKKLQSYSRYDMITYAPISDYMGEPKNTDCAFRVRNMIAGMVNVFDVVQKNELKGGMKKIRGELQEIYNADASKIKQRTLLVNEDGISTSIKAPAGHVAKKLSKEQFDEKYPFKFEYVKKEKIAEVIKEKSTDYYYLELASGSDTHVFVIDPSDGKVVFFKGQEGGRQLTEKDVEDLTDAINGKK
jgi:hypothetical protein